MSGVLGGGTRCEVEGVPQSQFDVVFGTGVDKRVAVAVLEDAVRQRVTAENVAGQAGVLVQLPAIGSRFGAADGGDPDEGGVGRAAATSVGFEEDFHSTGRDNTTATID